MPQNHHVGTSIVLVVTLLALVSPALGQTGSAATTLIVAMPGTVEQIDPNFAIASWSAQTVIANIYDVLTEYETRPSPEGYVVDDTEKVTGAAARTVEVTDGGKRIVYRLRDGLKFHDGTPLDAKALKFTMDRIVNTKGVGFGYFDLAGARTVDSFQVVDDRTLAVQLEQPNPLAVKLIGLLNIAPVNPKLIQQHATPQDPWARNWLATNPAGSGPFVLERLAPTSEVVLVRNPSYWKGPAKLERVIIKIIPSVADRVLSLERGSLDMITEVPPKNIAALRGNPAVKVLSVPSRRMQIFGMNANVAPFNNVKVRQAICAAMPYDTIIKQAFHGHATRLRSGIAQGTPTYTDRYAYETNLDRAKALLTEAGLASGFRTTLAIRAGFEEDEEAAVWIKSNLQKIGVTVDIDTLPLAAFVTKGRAKEHPTYINNHAYWINDPYYTYYFLHRTGGASSYTGYSNKEVDKLIADFMISPDAAARTKASDRIQQLLQEDPPFCYLAQANVNVAMRRNVQGYHFSFDATHLTRFHPMAKQ
jgi:peptide/nickel transport system substrate-binding protein